MSDRDLQAPWIGLCREDYEDRFRRKSEDDIIGYCEECGKALYEDDEIYDVCDGCICEECHAKHEEDEEQGGEDDEH